VATDLMLSRQPQAFLSFPEATDDRHIEVARHDATVLATGRCDGVTGCCLGDSGDV